MWLLFFSLEKGLFRRRVCLDEWGVFNLRTMLELDSSVEDRAFVVVLVVVVVVVLLVLVMRGTMRSSGVTEDG